jgi:hypothetical protein
MQCINRDIIGFDIFLDHAQGPVCQRIDLDYRVVVIVCGNFLRVDSGYSLFSSQTRDPGIQV